MSATLCFRIDAPAAEHDRLLAEVHSLGCLGVHEQDGVLHAYFPTDAAPDAVLRLEDGARGVRVHGPEPVADQDWERTWRAGLAPRRVGPLWIRPSWCASRGGPELVIDPQQAFGSGEHATTRLCLELLLEALEPEDALLDLGTGSGILGLAALRQGAGLALGVEIDPVACRNAAENGARNALRLTLVCGTLAAIDPRARFELVVANLLRRRLEPWLERLAGHCGRSLLLGGYLEGESGVLLGPLLDAGWRLVEERTEEQSGDRWCAAHLAHRRARQSSSRASRVSSSV